MPGPPSSLIDPAISHLTELAGDGAGEHPGLLAVLAGVADPRRRWGVRHRLSVILGLALCAVLAGARSFTAMAEWAADADGETLRVLGVTGVVPSESTFRRTLQRLDADAFDDRAETWAQQAGGWYWLDPAVAVAIAVVVAYHAFALIRKVLRRLRPAAAGSKT